jgi:toxin ParE1/3/4
MTEEEHRWTVRLAAAAEADYRNIVDWTVEQFGDLQARNYADTLSAALITPAEGPTTVGVRERAEIGRGLYTLHVARDGHRGRHFVLFRVGPSGRRQRHIEVLRLLHDAMDLKLHVRDT